MIAFLGPDGKIAAVFATEAEAKQQQEALGLQGLFVPVQDGADPARLKVHYHIKLEKFDGDTGALLETIERESEEPMFG